MDKQMNKQPPFLLDQEKFISQFLSSKAFLCYKYHLGYHFFPSNFPVLAVFRSYASQPALNSPSTVTFEGTYVNWSEGCAYKCWNFQLKTIWPNKVSFQFPGYQLNRQYLYMFVCMCVSVTVHILTYSVLIHKLRKWNLNILTRLQLRKL